MPSKSFIKVIGLILLLSLGPASIYFLYKRTGGLESRDELAFHRNIRFEFMAGTDSVDLRPLTDWSWETVCAFGSGLSQAEVNALVGFSYDNFSQLTWRNLSDHWTLLFIDSERETSWGLHRPVTPIRIPTDDISGFNAGEGARGSCAEHDTARLALERREVPLGKTPVVARLIDEASVAGEQENVLSP
ncbi:MAG: hypothetical protein GKS03_02250 [Alphaproteobacteria bacterium]|nr:hypothetical protein [Alphaproteobacteria bacterium]